MGTERARPGVEDGGCGRELPQLVGELGSHPPQALEDVLVLRQVVTVPDGLVVRHAVAELADAVETVVDLGARGHAARPLLEGEVEGAGPQARPRAPRVGIRVAAERHPEPEVQLGDQVAFRPPSRILHEPLLGVGDLPALVLHQHAGNGVQPGRDPTGPDAPTRGDLARRPRHLVAERDLQHVQRGLDRVHQRQVPGVSRHPVAFVPVRGIGVPLQARDGENPFQCRVADHGLACSGGSGYIDGVIPR